MNESELRKLLFRIGARCNIEQYEMLKRCSKTKDITEWNEWREDNPKEEIWLSGAYLQNTHLKGAKFRVAHLERANLDKTHLEDADITSAHLEGARLFEAHLKNADLSSAHLESVILSATDMESADLSMAYMEGAELCQANLKGAHLGGVHLEGANMFEAHLEGAGLTHSYLKGADLQDVHLEGADMYEAHLEGAKLVGAYLEGTNFEIATVDSSTLIWDCKVNKQTDFAGVGMDRARVEPGVKQLLEYNIRLRYWRRWYKKHRFGQYPVRLFWSISDYGRSTGWIAFWFFAFAFAFAGIYCRWPDLLALTKGGQIRGFWHALYFSVVTMTTLGFGDIHANPDNWFGQALLMFQVILGYILLGALVTRFAVLFTAGGPAAKFSKKKTKCLLLRIQLRTLRKRTSEK